jgi:hypothetical protein
MGNRVFTLVSWHPLGLVESQIELNDSLSKGCSESQENWEALGKT